MPKFDVSCFNRATGKLLWSQTQEADGPAWAIARATLPEDQRIYWVDFTCWIVKHGDVEEFCAMNELTVPHPGNNMKNSFDVAAERIDE